MDISNRELSSFEYNLDPDTGLYAWTTGEFDDSFNQRVKEIMNNAVCFGLVDQINHESIENRRSWGEKIDGGSEGRVYRPVSSPDFAVKIFKKGVGSQTTEGGRLEGQDILDSRAGSSIVSHNKLNKLLEDDDTLTTPKAYGVATHPATGLSLTVLDFVDGTPVSDDEASEIHAVASLALERKGVSELDRKFLLHDIKQNGGNVLRLAGGEHAIIDR